MVEGIAVQCLPYLRAMLGRHFVVPLAVCVLLLVAPSTAVALQLNLVAEGSKGSRVFVEGFGNDTVKLSTVNFRRGLASTEYVVEGRVSPRSIQARFGRFGRVSVRFQPSGKVTHRKPSGPCRGETATVRSGRFVGSIRFTGERGYTKVRARRAAGSVTAPSWKCKYDKGIFELPPNIGKFPGVEQVALSAYTPRRIRGFGALELTSSSSDDSSIAMMMARIAERRRGIRITRQVITFEKSNAFSLAPHFASATVSPSPPFHGTATFERDAEGGGSWSGSLGVTFPGRVTYSLAGPTFSAYLNWQA